MSPNDVFGLQDAPKKEYLVPKEYLRFNLQRRIIYATYPVIHSTCLSFSTAVSRPGVLLQRNKQHVGPTHLQPT